jgi:hypothetical protein
MDLHEVLNDLHDKLYKANIEALAGLPIELVREVRDAAANEISARFPSTDARFHRLLRQVIQQAYLDACQRN